MSRFSKKSSRSRKRQNKEIDYCQLEQKNLLASIVGNSATGTITVEGSASADTVLITNSSSNQIRVNLTANGQLDSQFFSLSVFDRIVVNGRGGDDFINHLGSIEGRLNGQNGNDTVFGGPVADDLRGGNGNDTIIGRAGDDFLRGGNNDDLLGGQDGNDRLIGNAGNDVFLFRSVTTSTSEIDRIVENPNSGVDRLSFSLVGSNESLNVNLSLNGTNPTIATHSNRQIRSGDAADLEQITGTDGNDVLVGNDANNTIVAGAGNDQIDGRGGNDFLRGGLGADRFDFGVASSQEFDTIDENAEVGSDIIIFSSIPSSTPVSIDLTAETLGSRVIAQHQNRSVFVATSGEEANLERAIGTAGADVIIGNNANNSLFGSAGNDRIEGRGGNDFIGGGGGNDTIFGNSGNDALRGNDGADVIFGGFGDDSLLGGLDSDVDSLDPNRFEINGGNIGNDRYLAEANGVATDESPSPSITLSAPDFARVTFQPGPSTSGGQQFFSDFEVEQIDDAFELLIAEAGINVLSLSLIHI